MGGSSFHEDLIHVPMKIVGMAPIGIEDAHIDEISARCQIESFDGQLDEAIPMERGDGDSCGARVRVEANHPVRAGDGQCENRRVEGCRALELDFNCEWGTAS